MARVSTFFQTLRTFFSRHTLVSVLSIFAVFFLAQVWLQFSTPNMPDNDGFYHIRFAALMREQGLKPDFPWLPLTILNEREFYDHHFLYHVALIPFTYGDLRLGAKWSSVLFSSLAFTMLYILLRGQRVPYASLWALGLLAVSQGFLFRMNVTRAQSLSLGVLLLGLHWMLLGKYRWLAPLSFLFVWLYDAFPLLPLLAALYGAGVWLAERRFEWRPLFWSGLGVGLGLLINPYFPVNLVFTFRHILPKLGDATEVRVGSEWYPYDTQQLWENSWLALAAFVSGALAWGLRGQRMEARAAASFLMAVLFGWMLFQARRFIEYFPPFALVFSALAWAPLLAPQPTSEDSAQTKAPLIGEVQLERYSSQAAWSVHNWFRRRSPLLLLLGALVLGMALTLPAARRSVQTAKPFDLYAQASAWLAENTPAGARIFQTDWDDFPRLFFYNTRNTYLVGLDPTYLQLYDEDRYDLWRSITQGEVEQPSGPILAYFGASYVLSDLNHTAFMRRAAEDPGLLEVYRDDQAVIYSLIDQ